MFQVNQNLADYRFPSEWQQISRLDLDKVSAFIIHNNFNFRTILKQHLSAISARRYDTVMMLLVNSNNCIKFPFSVGNSNTNGNVFSARPVNAIAVYTFVDISVFTQNRAPDRMIVNTVIKIIR